MCLDVGVCKVFVIVRNVFLLELEGLINVIILFLFILKFVFLIVLMLWFLFLNDFVIFLNFNICYIFYLIVFNGFIFLIVKMENKFFNIEIIINIIVNMSNVSILNLIGIVLGKNVFVMFVNSKLNVVLNSVNMIVCEIIIFVK